MNCKNVSICASTFAGILIYIEYGIILAWNSPTLDKFRSNNTEINPLGEPISALQLSICTSIFPVSSIVTSMGVAKLPDIFGRRTTLICTALLGFTSFIAMGFVNNIWAYCFVQFLSCLSVSAGMIVTPTYLSEISKTQNRGMLSSTCSLGKTVGQLYIFVLVLGTNFQSLSFCCVVPYLILILLSFYLQESPIFLWMQGKSDRAINTMKKLNRSSSLNELEQETREKQAILRSANANTKNSLQILFGTPAGRRALFLTMVVRGLSAFTGAYVILSFLGDFLREPTHLKISAGVIAVILIITKIMTALFSVVFVDKFGRRIFMLTGTFLLSVSLFILGFYYFFKEKNAIIPDNVKLIPVIFVFVFFIGYTMSFSGVSFALLSEILPNEARSIGTGFIAFVTDFCILLQTLGYPLVSKYFGVHYFMFFYGVFTIIGFVLCLIFLPETKGKTFSEIRTILESRK
ncbi:unnamed protein product [Phyllotreta striolata]|uniref:Major facilitator superfamily (MFS) profile domain-containing protein n=1 Tax=Phyllotreta striolata TaxID=444603 RepID=A0A9N9XK39_PHYSR|nr:unnamed protein product [Phyllotreta striolata]